MTPQEMYTKLCKLAETAHTEEVYLELGEPLVQTDPTLVAYGIFRESVGFQRGKQDAFKQALRLLATIEASK